jgi:hypothetical protein
MREVFKSPIMAALLIPAGPIDGDVMKLNVAWLVLVFSAFLQVLALSSLTIRLQIPLSTVLLAALAVCLNPQLHQFQGAFLADYLLSFTILNSFLLFALEATREESNDRGAALRGAMWGLQCSIGMLTKLTYGYFGLLLFAPAMWLGKKRPRHVVIKVTSAMIVGAAPAFLLLAYAEGFLNHAFGASFGSISKFYTDNLSTGAFISSEIRGARVTWLIVILIVIQATWRRDLDRRRLWTALYLMLIVVGYFIISTLSANRDPRFFFPVWVVLPWCVAVGVAPKDLYVRILQPGAGATLVQMLLIVLLLLPGISHFNFRELEEARSALDVLPKDRKVTVLLASDEPGFNVETLILARELDYSAFHDMDIETVV